MRNRPKSSGESGARYSMFVTLRDGLSSLVEAIAARLPARRGAVEYAGHAHRTLRQTGGVYGLKAK